MFYAHVYNVEREICAKRLQYFDTVCKVGKTFLGDLSVHTRYW